MKKNTDNIHLFQIKIKTRRTAKYERQRMSNQMGGTVDALTRKTTDRREEKTKDSMMTNKMRFNKKNEPFLASTD